MLNHRLEGQFDVEQAYLTTRGSDKELSLNLTAFNRGMIALGYGEFENRSHEPMGGRYSAAEIIARCDEFLSRSDGEQAALWGFAESVERVPEEICPFVRAWPLRE